MNIFHYMPCRIKDDFYTVKVMTSWWGSSSQYKNHLCSCRTYNENWMGNISFIYYDTNLNFQGCYIYDNLDYFKLNGNPDPKRNIRFFIFMVKNLKIWNLFFSVPKKSMSGFPYLRRGQWNFYKNNIFKIPMILLFSPR